MLKAQNISHSFDYTLFDNVNIHIKCNSTNAIIGASGSGKSTILHILSTLLKPQNGEVFFNEKSIYKLSLDELLSIRRYDFGIIFQSHYLFRGFSAKENIELASILSKKNIDYSLFERLKITDVLNQKVGELSGGQQQRVSIARILTKEPKIIFADEPTGNLDANTADEVMKVIFEYVKNKNAALMLITHDEKLASKCDNIYKLENKKLIQNTL